MKTEYNQSASKTTQTGGFFLINIEGLIKNKNKPTF